LPIIKLFCPANVTAVRRPPPNCYCPPTVPRLLHPLQPTVQCRIASFSRSLRQFSYPNRESVARPAFACVRLPSTDSASLTRPPRCTLLTCSSLLVCFFLHLTKIIGYIPRASHSAHHPRLSHPPHPRYGFPNSPLGLLRRELRWPLHEPDHPGMEPLSASPARRQGLRCRRPVHRRLVLRLPWPRRPA
jgi:hypothetical protein